MSYTAANKSATEALDWMTNQNANILSLLRIAREASGNPGADLVIMVVPGTTSNNCGAAETIPRVASRLNSESNAFAIVVLEEADPRCREEISVPHEFGHLLYAEHENDTNGDDLLPSFNNHATASSNTSFGVNLKSLMWGQGISDDVSNFLSGSRESMTTAWADNVEFMSDDSFKIVASYRSLLPPAPRETYKVYWQPNCIGGYTEYASLNIALNDGGVSYRVASSTGTSNFLCWFIAVIGGE